MTERSARKDEFGDFFRSQIKKIIRPQKSTKRHHQSYKAFFNSFSILFTYFKALKFIAYAISYFPMFKIASKAKTIFLLMSRKFWLLSK